MLAAAAVAITMVASTSAAQAQSRTYRVSVWASNVNVRDNTSSPACNQYPSVSNCWRVLFKVSKQDILVYCQKRGQPVTDSGYHSEWWSYVVTRPGLPSGWISNVYIRGKAHLDGVPDCTF